MQWLWPFLSEVCIFWEQNISIWPSAINDFFFKDAILLSVFGFPQLSFRAIPSPLSMELQSCTRHHAFRCHMSLVTRSPYPGRVICSPNGGEEHRPLFCVRPPWFLCIWLPVHAPTSFCITGRTPPGGTPQEAPSICFLQGQWRHLRRLLAQAAIRALADKCPSPRDSCLCGDLRLCKYSVPQQAFTRWWIGHFHGSCKMKVFQLHPSLCVC